MSIDVRAFRQAMGQFVTGVTVVATEVGGEIKAMTVNSFTSLSLDPPLVLFCAGKATRTGQVVHEARGFSVNILSLEQESLSTYFAGGWKQPEPPPFEFARWEGGPRLEGCVAALGCTMHAIVEGGDHWIVMGQVVALHNGTGGARHPLVFCGGRYARLAHATGAAAPDLQGSTGPILTEHW